MPPTSCARSSRKSRRPSAKYAIWRRSAASCKPLWGTLGSQAQELEKRLQNQRRAGSNGWVYRQYLQGNPDALRLLLSGDEPNQMARDLHYLAAIGRARRRAAA